MPCDVYTEKKFKFGNFSALSCQIITCLILLRFKNFIQEHLPHYIFPFYSSVYRNSRLDYNFYFAFIL